jgi:hypothetical protein
MNNMDFAGDIIYWGEGEVYTLPKSVQRLWRND